MAHLVIFIVKKLGRRDNFADEWIYDHTDSLVHVPCAWICLKGILVAKAKEAADLLKIWIRVSKGRFA
jgi:hypothetical protein